MRTGELQKDARRVRVPDQSIQILQALLERDGDVVTREELRTRLWPAGTFVDFEHGLNSAVRRLRDALGDSADKPKLIETLPRRGYRFIGVIEGAGTEPTTQEPLPEPESGPPAPDTGRAVAHVAARPSRPRAWWAVAAAAVAFAGVVLTVNGTWLRGANAATAPWSATPARLTFEDGLQTDPSFAPDGQSFVYAGNAAGNFDIYTRAVAEGDAVAITTHPAHDWQPDWSPDGAIAFRSERDGGGIFVVPATGGVARKVTDFGYRPQWSPDGRAMVFTRSILAGADNALYLLAGLDSTRHLRSGPSGAYGWTPDSRRILTLSNTAAPLIVDVDIATEVATEWTFNRQVLRRFRELQIAVAAFEKLAWSADGRTVFFIGEARGVRSVWRLELDIGAQQVTGGPDRVTALPDASNFDLSPTGDRLLFDGSTRTAQLWSHELDSEGRVVQGREWPVSFDAADAVEPAISTDGAWLAFMRTRPGGRQPPALVVREVATGREEVIQEASDDRASIYMPRWSHRADRLSYVRIARQDVDAPQLQVRVFDMASRRDEPLTSLGAEIEFANSWTPDDGFIVSAGRRYVDGRWAVVRLPIAGAPQADRAVSIVTSVERGSLYQPSMSPDGRWIVFRYVNRPDVPVGQIAIVAAEGGNRSRWTMVTHGPLSLDKPRWSPRGDRLYFTATDGALVNVWSITFDTTRGQVVGEPRQETAYTDPAFHLLPNMIRLELAVGGNRLIVPIVRPKGGIWLAER